jgi:hypothetical protein
MTHLDDTSFAALQADPSAHAELLEHLAAGCEVCDDFLARHSDAFDGPVDAQLLSLAPTSPAPLDEVGWARLRRTLRAKPPRRWLTVAALAAGLVVAVGVGAWRTGVAEDDAQGLKGAAPHLELQAAVRTEGGRLERLVDASRVSSHATLVFRAQSSLDGVARVFVQRDGQAPEELGVVRVRAGLHPLSRDDGLLGFELSGESGPLSVWVVVGETPMTAQEAREALQSHGTDSLAVARVHLFVEP